MDKEERKMARKVLTKEMKEWEEERYVTQAADTAEGVLSSIADRLKMKIDKSKREN